MALEQAIYRHELEAPGGQDPRSEVRLAAHGFTHDHGVLVPRDEMGRDFLLEMIPKIGQFEKTADGRVEIVPGVDGKKVGGFPVKCPQTGRTLEPLTCVLRLWHPEHLVDPGLPIQRVLEAALIKSKILPTTHPEAFQGAKAFYWDAKTKNILCFTALPATVAAIMTDRRAVNGSGPGMLYAGFHAQPVYHKHQRLSADTCIDYGHYTLKPQWPAGKNGPGGT